MSVLVIGSTNIDITVQTEKLPSKGETVLGKNISFRFGGKGANQACACGKLGAEITFLTAVGDDKYGKDITAYLRSCNVDISRVKYSKDHLTGTAVINVAADGANSIVVVQGANLDCDCDYIMQNEDCFKECNYVLIQMEIPLEAIELSIKLAAKYGKKIVLNPAPANSKIDKDLYKLITYITPNETEAEIMAYGKKINGDLSKAANKLLGDGVSNVVMTLGSNGATLYRSNKTTISKPAYKVKAIDTVAAGDCFNGALVTALEQGKDEESSLKFANMASAIAVTRHGTQESIPTLDEVDFFQL